MNFNNIPKGLLAPLFFGEISVNGNVPDSLNNGGTNPPISCEGATQGIRFFDFSSPMLIYVNDELLSDDLYGYQNEFLWINYDIDLYSDDSGLLSLLNNGTTARRIKFVIDDDSVPNVSDNPTFLAFGNKTYGVCLAHNPNQISCVGATSIINFPYIEGDWRFYLDDFEYSVVTGLANDFTSYLNTEMADKLRGDFDGFFWVENLDTQPHRIKMLPNNSEGGQIFTTPTNNPTFIEHEDGSLTFCLAAVD